MVTRSYEAQLRCLKMHSERILRTRPDGPVQTPLWGRVPSFPASLSVLRRSLLRRMDRNIVKILPSGGRAAGIFNYARTFCFEIKKHLERRSRVSQNCMAILLFEVIDDTLYHGL